jgi:antitoxin FitA
VATLTIRDVDDELRIKLRVRAAEKGHSMAAEVREILRNALAVPTTNDRLGSRIQQRFSDIGGVELALPPRDELPRVPSLP